MQTVSEKGAVAAAFAPVKKERPVTAAHVKRIREALRVFADVSAVHVETVDGCADAFLSDGYGAVRVFGGAEDALLVLREADCPGRSALLRFRKSGPVAALADEVVVRTHSAPVAALFDTVDPSEWRSASVSVGTADGGALDVLVCDGGVVCALVDAARARRFSGVESVQVSGRFRPVRLLDGSGRVFGLVMPGRFNLDAEAVTR